MLNNLPNGWIECKLGDVADLQNGNSIAENIKKTKYTNLTEGYNYIGTKDIDNNHNINYENGVKIPFNEAKFKHAYPNDTLLCIEGGSAGKKSAYLSQKVCFGNKLCCFHSHSAEPKYIYYFIQSNIFLENFKFNLSGLIGGVSLKKIQNIKIPLPPLAEQQKIVNKIEREFRLIDEGIKILKKTQEQIKQYRHSVLNSAFNGNLYKTTEWKNLQFREIIDINPKTDIPNLSDSDLVSFLPMSCVEAEINQYSEESIHYLKVKKGYTKFQNNDILFAKITPCMENGKACIVNNLKYGVGFGSTEFHILRCSKAVYNKFIFYFISQLYFRKKAQSFMVGAVGQRRVPAEYIKNLDIYLPPLAEQQKIVKEIEKRFNAINSVEIAVNQSLSKAKQLKQSILKIAFEGRLVAQDLDKDC